MSSRSVFIIAYYYLTVNTLPITYIDGTDVICLQLLLRLLHPCGLGKNGVFLKCVEVILIFMKYKYYFIASLYGCQFSGKKQMQIDVKCVLLIVFLFS